MRFATGLPVHVDRGRCQRSAAFCLVRSRATVGILMATPATSSAAWWTSTVEVLAAPVLLFGLRAHSEPARRPPTLEASQQRIVGWAAGRLQPPSLRPDRFLLQASLTRRGLPPSPERTPTGAEHHVHCRPSRHRVQVRLSRSLSTSSKPHGTNCGRGRCLWAASTQTER